MKISKLLLVAFAMLSIFASCSKDNDDSNPVDIEGRWIGSYINDASGNSFYFSFKIKPGGVIEEVNNSGVAIGAGTWELDAATNVFTAKYTWYAGGIYSVIAAFDSESAKLVGDWGYGDSNTDGGSWEMTKSN